MYAFHFNVRCDRIFLSPVARLCRLPAHLFYSPVPTTTTLWGVFRSLSFSLSVRVSLVLSSVPFDNFPYLSRPRLNVCIAKFVLFISDPIGMEMEKPSLRWMCARTHVCVQFVGCFVLFVAGNLAPYSIQYVVYVNRREQQRLRCIRSFVRINARIEWNRNVMESQSETTHCAQSPLNI